MLVVLVLVVILLYYFKKHKLGKYPLKHVKIIKPKIHKNSHVVHNKFAIQILQTKSTCFNIIQDLKLKNGEELEDPKQ